MMIQYLLFALWGFLSGSILFCKRIPKKVKGIDICALSKDGNPGTANVFVHCGIPLGTVCLLLELFKGFAPTFAATMLLGSHHYAFVLVVVAPALGHAIAPFDRFKGGKCIAVIFGILLGTVTETWTGWILVGLYLLFFAIVRLKPNRICSIVTYSLFAAIAPLILFVQGKFPLGVGYFLLAVIALVRHIRTPE
ncbi:MAG: glycerol-3-phosphate acyltransferase [Clostridia bacterium]|nr:glycerol-3-phosphate acyltransferase [Clostridia bacterium]